MIETPFIARVKFKLREKWSNLTPDERFIRISAAFTDAL
jgi:hypothetical protein